MTCPGCRHEFCWSCLCDRTVIYAHGNHFHAPTCRFYAAYAGKKEFIPKACRRCKQRGRACTPPPPPPPPPQAPLQPGVSVAAAAARWLGIGGAFAGGA
mmetsp:Transcript_83068/g.178054  ORF Transcript_83068/g.178054 Transcript_83068/m.178054 type:complete len:99 (+) Transcript_83068:368-664(+)